jgi:hypothetical protein
MKRASHGVRRLSLVVGILSVPSGIFFLQPLWAFILFYCPYVITGSAVDPPLVTIVISFALGCAAFFALGWLAVQAVAWTWRGFLLDRRSSN